MYYRIIIKNNILPKQDNILCNNCYNNDSIEDKLLEKYLLIKIRII